MDVSPTFAVVGIEHLHLFEIVEALAAAGARCVAHSGDGPLADMFASWQTDSTPCAESELLDRTDVDIVVIASVPDHRASLTCRALEAGHHVVSDKPGALSEGDVDDIVDAARRADRRWWVIYSERLGNRAMTEAIRLAVEGELGQVVGIDGWGPHSLFEESRPDWFWDRRRSGGVLIDFGCHQVDQFCSIVDPQGRGTVELIGAARGNVAHPDRPAFDDVAEITLGAPGVRGVHRVDVFSPAGLGTWGDCRLRIVGTDATAEVRANVDVGGQSGGEHLLVVDAASARRVVPPPVTGWADLALADLADGTDSFMALEHVAQVTRLCAQAAERAQPWDSADRRHP